jgi:ribosome assembly protein RRB1
MYLAAGTQADRAANNKILVMKCSQLHRTTHDDDEGAHLNAFSFGWQAGRQHGSLTFGFGRFPADADDNDDDLDDDPIIEFKTVKHTGAVNRIRVRSHRAIFAGPLS